MIKLETLKRIAQDIIADDEWVNDSHSQAEHTGVTDGLNRLIRHLEETNQYNDLKEAETEDLKQELRLRGWCTKDMWHVDDVTAKYDCTSEQAMDVLEEVLSSDSYMESTFDAIDDQAEHMEYHTIYNNDGE